MIPDDVLQKLDGLDGYLTGSEGRALAELARIVPADQAIVEVGSFKGKSACYLGIGSRLGASARIYAVDLWELHDDPKYASPEVFRRWCEQIAEMKLTDLVTPIRCESTRFSGKFSEPIGLLFIDGNHSFESVASDFFSWSPKVADGGMVAFHDYRKAKVGRGVTDFIDQQVAASPDWRVERIVDSLLIARRGTSSLPPEGRLTYVDNKELEKQLAKRPPQYGLELARIVPKRDDDGIYVDTQSPDYQPLKVKYSDYRPPRKPLEQRVRELCEACPVGSNCRFPRLPKRERREILASKDPAVWEPWCETKDWGGAADFVYPYVAGPAQGDELRFSLRSLEKNFVGTPHVWIVGDEPGWYRGNHIPHERIPPCRHRPRFDQVAKLKKMLREKQIASEFVWMMDDVYFLEPITLGELKRPYMRGRFNLEKLQRYRPTNDWLRAKQLTFETLAKEGLPINDTGAHLPYVYEKTKLRQLLQNYRLDENPYVLNLLYCNVYATYLPRQSHEILRRDQGQGSAGDILKQCQSALILNHPDGGYTPAMKEALQQLFPEPSSFERG